MNYTANALVRILSFEGVNAEEQHLLMHLQVDDFVYYCVAIVDFHFFGSSLNHRFAYPLGCHYQASIYVANCLSKALY